MSQAIVKLRAALLQQDRVTADALALQLMSQIDAPLRAYGDRLVRSTGRSLGLEGVDLAQEAWARAFLYLLKPEGEAIQTDEHFIRLLCRIVHQRFLDALDQARGRGEWELDAPVSGVSLSETWADRVCDSRGPKSLLWLGEGRRQELVHALFEGKAAFLAVCQARPRRRLNQYRACVVIALAEFYQQEDVPVGLFERYLELIGVPAHDWEQVRQSLERPGTTEASLFAAVNACYGTRIQSRMFLSVLRYELNLLAGETGGKRDESD